MKQLPDEITDECDDLGDWEVPPVFHAGHAFIALVIVAGILWLGWEIVSRFIGILADAVKGAIPAVLALSLVLGGCAGFPSCAGTHEQRPFYITLYHHTW